MYKVSFYTSHIRSKEAHVNQTIDLATFFDWIKGKWQKNVEAIRRAAPGATQDKLKLALPYITLSGIFQPGTRSNDTLQQHSNLLQVDIDESKNPDLAPEPIRQQLIKDPFALAVMLSPRGKGLKVVVKINGNNHLQEFEAVEAYFLAQYGLTIDKQCKDVSRPFFATYDPAISMNWNSLPFKPVPGATLAIQPPKRKQATQTPAPMGATGTDKKLQDIERLCAELEARRLDITNRNGYDDWLNIGFAIANGIGEGGRSFYHRISSLASNYNPQESNKQFTACCKNPNGGRRWETLFGIAKDFGVVIRNGSTPAVAQPSPALAPAKAKQDAPPAFYKAQVGITNGSKFLKGIELDEIDYLHYLEAMGFSYQKLDDNATFIRSECNIIEEVDPQRIQEAVMKQIRSLPEQVDELITRHELLKVVVRKNERLFGRALLSMLHSDEAISFNTDSKRECFLYYQNGFVSCKSGSYSFHPYQQLQKGIWREQIIKRDFVKLPQTDKPINESNGNFAKFIYNVAGQNVDRFYSLCTIIGYLLHDYKEGKLKAVVLTDSNLSEDNEGRTGKTLFGKALKQLRNVCELNGKDFKTEEKFKYQAAQLSTQIMFLNDARAKFNLESLYNDITEGITIEKKNQAPATVKLKYLITTNRVINTKGGSSLDRVIEFEFSSHYSYQYSPEQEFKQWFFKDWNAAEWQHFDNFMCICIALYLENGVMAANRLNLDKRKLIGSTCQQFYDFVEDGHIKPDEDFCLQHVCERFQELYPDYNFNTQYPTKKFSKWLKELPGYDENFKGLALIFLKKSNTEHYYKFSANQPTKYEYSQPALQTGENL